MIGPGTGVRVYVASGITDMRKGIHGLAAAAEQILRQNPCSGAVFAFRGRKGDRVKLLYWDQQGFCLYYKVLQRGRFPWPSPADGVVRLTSAQLAMLWEGAGNTCSVEFAAPKLFTACPPTYRALAGHSVWDKVDSGQ